MISRVLHWLRFNIKYIGKPPWDTGISPPELLEFIASHPPGRALDLGCGTGTNLVTMARAVWDVTGVDFAMKAIRSSRQRLKQQGLIGEVIHGDVTQLHKPGLSFNLVLDIGCYHGLPENRRLIYRENLLRYLHIQGTFLVYAHLKSTPDARVGVSEDELAAFQSLFVLQKRQDSLDRLGRKAVWLSFLHSD
jgi:cyclopropane fatty-acyl-phospholipid synthase-like methyltransferase